MNLQVELPTTKDQKAKAVDGAVAAILKQHGNGTITKLGARGKQPYPHLSTGLISLDHKVLGIGGLPRGRITEIYGPESGGKTTLALSLISRAQAVGDLCAYIDAEHALDPAWCKKLGVNTDDLFVSQPDSGEQGLDVALTLVESGGVGVVVIDSVAALVPRAELDGDIGDSNVGLHARLMSQAMRKFAGVVNRTGTVVIMINQIREKIGVMFGSPETTTGGRALKFFASVRLDVRRISTIKSGDTPVGNLVRIKAVKNKLCPPFRETEVPLLFDRGFDVTGNLVDAAVETGVLTKSGSWFSMGDKRLGQGRDTVVELARSDADFAQKVLEETLKKLES